MWGTSKASVTKQEVGRVGTEVPHFQALWPQYICLHWHNDQSNTYWRQQRNYGEVNSRAYRVMLAVQLLSRSHYKNKSYADPGQTWQSWRISFLQDVTGMSICASTAQDDLRKSSFTHGKTLQKPFKVFHSDEIQPMLLHPLNPQLPMEMVQLCKQVLKWWPCGKAVQLWYTLTTTQHWVWKQHNNDGCLQVSGTTRLYYTIHNSYMDRDLVSAYLQEDWTVL